ncbi:hypothetical protein FSP39_012371 [Pinctada imbricata]|uniref:Uncharacterized protein n=1 Tax=Pinctada imbricata TaxID=66713 RepID=A0AA89C198_PINIB|nr:hypothetical protein FSP39_012371 [Pinctada imbricata]
MNKEKQDILYSRARAVLNHNVKRLWFKINPFLERKKTLKGKPEYETKFVQPLKSALLCENYIINQGDESARDSRNVPMEKFWDFLYSDEWSNGCAIRVLEGELMEELMYWLHVCVQDKSVATHKTFAFARNKRERRGCYKLANQKGCVEIEETLLIEFTYYGNPVEPPSSSDIGSSCYKDSTSTSSEIPIIKSSGAELDDSGKPTEQSFGDSILPPIREGSLYTTGQDVSGTEPQFRGHTGMQKLQVVDIVPKLMKMQRFPSNDSTDSSGTWPSFKENLAMFRCTERIESGSEVESSIYEISDESDLANVDFGEELYLSDKMGSHKVESTADKLARNKVMLARRRETEKVRQNLRERSQNRMKLPTMPDFDMDKIGLGEKGVSTFKFAFMVTKVPSFEEFLNILDTEERFDPRYKKSRQMNKKIARRYNLTKETLNKRNLELVDMNADIKKRFNVLGKLQIFTRKAGGGLNEISEESKPVASDIKVAHQLQLSHKKSVDSKIHIEKVAAAVNGVTDSKECEHHVLKNYSPSPTGKSEKRKSIVKPRLRIPRLIVTSPTGNITTIIGSVSPLQKYKPRTAVKSKKSLGKKDSKKDRSFVKVKAPSVISTEPYSTDSEDPEYGDNEFDTSRLNRKYSLDRLDKIKGKNFRKKKPAFYEILKKYYRAQRAVDLFTKSPSPDKKARKKSIFQRLLESKPKEPKVEMVLGKLRKFPFMRPKEIKKERDIDPFDFKNQSSEEFMRRLKQSLDDFVVRKEHVMSDYRGKTSTTLTFTRKEVFRAHHSL